MIHETVVSVPDLTSVFTASMPEFERINCQLVNHAIYDVFEYELIQLGLLHEASIEKSFSLHSV